MEKLKEYCSSKNHENIRAYCFCEQCQIFMCRKCDNYHSQLFKNHHIYNSNEEILNMNEDYKIVFRENDNKIEYYCNRHNELCCRSCITKNKDINSGKHSKCEIYLIEDNIESKKNKLKENIKFLENISKTINQSINKYLSIIDKISQNKEEILIDIQKFFTKIRNELNNKEDEILLDIESKFSLNEKSVIEYKKFSEKINAFIKKGEKIINENNNIIIFDESIKSENFVKEIKEAGKKINIINEKNKEIELLKENILLAFKENAKYGKKEEIVKFMKTNNINDYSLIVEKSSKIITIDIINRNEILEKYFQKFIKFKDILSNSDFYLKEDFEKIRIYIEETKIKKPTYEKGFENIGGADWWGESNVDWGEYQRIINLVPEAKRNYVYKNNGRASFGKGIPNVGVSWVDRNGRREFISIGNAGINRINEERKNDFENKLKIAKSKPFPSQSFDRIISKINEIIYDYVDYINNKIN